MKKEKKFDWISSLIILTLTGLLFSCQPQDPVFEEQDGFVAVEAEAYHSQELTDVRRWVRIDADYESAAATPDADESHYLSASGQAYLEALPDTRQTHADTLIHGENFSNEPGRIGVLHYRVRFNTPGKYYVWVRAFSTGTEDNGIHVGLDGEWVESGQRMQWCEDKNRWTWASKQRTQEEHCGVEKQIFLNIDEPGIHTISFSMREDGFEFDRWGMSKVYRSPG